jgi:hypothetical protein
VRLTELHEGTDYAIGPNLRHPTRATYCGVRWIRQEPEGKMVRRCAMRVAVQAPRSPQPVPDRFVRSRDVRMTWAAYENVLAEERERRLSHARALDLAERALLDLDVPRPSGIKLGGGADGNQWVTASWPLRELIRAGRQSARKG